MKIEMGIGGKRTLINLQLVLGAILTQLPGKEMFTYRAGMSFARELTVSEH